MKKVILIIMFCVTVSSCASNGNLVYSNISNTQTSVTPIEASRKDTSLSISTGEEIEIEITESDNILLNNNIYGNFKVISLVTPDPQSLTIVIRSLCDCFGYNKYILVPNIRIFNANQDALDITLVERQVLTPDDSFPASILYRYNSKNIPSGKYKIVIWADNSNLNKNIAELQGSALMPIGGNVYIPIDSKYNITSYPLGKLILGIKN